MAGGSTSFTATPGSAASSTADTPWYTSLGGGSGGSVGVVGGIAGLGGGAGGTGADTTPGATPLTDLFGGGDGSGGTPPTLSEYTSLAKTAAVLVGGGIAVYLLWPVLSTVRGSAKRRLSTDY